MFRVAFDPSLPVVASCGFQAAGRHYASGDAVDWRALGITEQTLLEWWNTCLVAHPLETVGFDVSDAKPDSASGAFIDHSTAGEKRTFLIDGEPVEFTSGPTISVETPAQRAQRRTSKSKR